VIENAELIAIIALGAMLFIGGVGAAYALGNLPKRSEFNSLRNELTAQIETSNKELSAKIEESHESLMAEIRRSHQQLLRALINHRHLEPDGDPIFTEPPDTELVAADN
jgi:hypothetical protein